MSEFGFVRWMQKTVKPSKEVICGIGDDAAVYRVPQGKHQLMTTDVIVEDVDFVRSRITPERIGRKALAINLSDIAAMGGIPRSAVITLIFPRRMKLADMKRLFSGMKKLADQFHVSLIGGDLSRGPSLICSVTVVGEADPSNIVYRSGAKVGDFIGVTGSLGGSILGHHADFVPRIKEGLCLARCGASSMIDVSDGLIQDLNHLTERSHLGYTLDLNVVPVSQSARQCARKNKLPALRHALCDGEDFELLFTIPSDRVKELLRVWKRKFKTKLTLIGKITKGSRYPNPQDYSGFRHF